MNLNGSFSKASNSQSFAGYQNQSLPVISNSNPRELKDIKRAKVSVSPFQRDSVSLTTSALDHSFNTSKNRPFNISATEPNELNSQMRASSVPRKRSVYESKNKIWLESIHTPPIKPGSRVSIPELRQKMDEITPDETILELNKRLQDDLSSLTENYMKIFLEYTGLQEEYKQILLNKNNKIKQYREEVYSKKLELELLKKQLDERERSETALKMDYESRLQRLRDDLAIEREERASLLEKITELKTKLLSTNDGKPSLKDDINPRERLKLEERVNSLTIELELNRNRFVDKQLKLEEERALRDQTLKVSRRTCQAGRIHFVGEAKPLEEIFGLLERLNHMALASKDRLLALEELCIFINSSDEAAEKLGLMGAAVVCTKSLASQDNAIVLRSVHVLNNLCNKNNNCAKQVVENGGIMYLKNCLASIDEV